MLKNDRSNIFLQKIRKNFFPLISLLILANTASVSAAPPFNGTIFIDRDIITAEDPTSYIDSTYTGRGQRSMFDRRVNTSVNVNAYLFRMTFSGGADIEAQVNPEFGSIEAAREQVERHAPSVGQIPARLRQHVKRLIIHDGTELYGGGSDLILVHVGQTALYERDGILEETMVHEAAHTSLDNDWKNDPAWLAAQQNDPDFISTYARDNPTREDIAESFLPYLAVRHRRDRISDSLYNTIVNTIPNRIAFFDAQNSDMFPTTPTAPSKNTASLVSPEADSQLSSTAVDFSWTRPPGATDFDLIIGTTGQGSSDIRSSHPFNDTQLEITGLPDDGAKVYATLWTWNGQWKAVHYTFTSFDKEASKATLTQPTPGGTLIGSEIVFEWETPLNNPLVDLVISTEGGAYGDVHASKPFRGKSLQISGIPQTGETVRVLLWTFIDTWTYKEYFFQTRDASSLKPNSEHSASSLILDMQ